MLSGLILQQPKIAGSKHPMRCGSLPLDYWRWPPKWFKQGYLLLRHSLTFSTCPRAFVLGAILCEKLMGVLLKMPALSSRKYHEENVKSQHFSRTTLENKFYIFSCHISCQTFLNLSPLSLFHACRKPQWVYLLGVVNSVQNWDCYVPQVRVCSQFRTHSPSHTVNASYILNFELHLPYTRWAVS